MFIEKRLEPMISDLFGLQAQPKLYDSQLAFRIGLARTRGRSYPLDSLDFIIMDLERPDCSFRHAHWCTGDLTGRYLEFLSVSDGIDGAGEPRMRELFERILKERRPSGLFGKYAVKPEPTTPENEVLSGTDRLFSGLMRYYERSGNMRALDAATGIAERLLSVQDDYIDHLRKCVHHPLEAWITEPLARLYGATGDRRYADFCARIAAEVKDIDKAHSHGFMSTLRGLQLMAIHTGDAKWNEKPERYRRKIIADRYEKADGCVSELFPVNFRNEGCSIADWLMLNLNAAYINDDGQAYEHAEHILWNALFFNQFVTGGFGTRGLLPYGYTGTNVEEAWWCCTHHAGIAMCEFARHAVVWRDGEVRVQLLVAGEYKLQTGEGRELTVSLRTAYPANSSTIIEVTGLPAETKVKIRIPSFMKNAELRETRSDGRCRIVLTGALGHDIVRRTDGEVLRFGPLVLAPMIYFWDNLKKDTDNSIPEGYIPPTMPQGLPALRCRERNGDGFLALGEGRRPDWVYYDLGPGARCQVEGAPVHVPVRFPNGDEKRLWFTPLCCGTSTLACFEVPILFPVPGDKA